MMWRTVIVLGCFVGAVFTSPVGLKDIPMTDDALLQQKTEMAMSTLNLPSNATSIRADITDGFDCDGRLYGYYADIDNDCQIFHVCLPVTYPDGKENTFRWSFICPEETLFSQESFTCVRTLDLGFDCAESARFYDLNRNFGIAGDIDSDMNDFLRLTPTETANAIPLEPKPAIPVTTARPLLNRRRPGEPNFRRQPTKAAATTQPSVIRAQPTRFHTTAAVPTPTAAPTPAEEIKPLFNRNELLKNSPITNIRKTSIRPVPVVEETKPVEIVPKVESPNAALPVIEEEVKKINVEPVQSEPVKQKETIIAEDGLKQLSAPLTPSVEIPEVPVEQIKLLPEPESKPSLPVETLATAANENRNEPVETILENSHSITKATPELPMIPMSEEKPQEIPADEQKDQLPMIDTRTSADSETLKLSDSSSAASTESKLTEGILALPETSLPQKPIQKLVSAEMAMEPSPPEEKPMKNLSITKTESLENDQAPLSSMIQETQPEIMQLEPELEAMTEQENLKKVPEQQNLEKIQDQTNLEEVPAQENSKTVHAEPTVEKVDTLLASPESLPEQPLVLEDPIVKHVLESIIDNKNIDEPLIIEQAQPELVQDQQLKTETLSGEKLKSKPEMPMMAEATLEQMENDQPLGDSKPMSEMPASDLMMKEPEKSLPEMTPEINAATPEMAMETITENAELLKTENEQQAKLDLPAEMVTNVESIPEAVKNEEILMSKPEEQMPIAEVAAAESQSLKKEPEMPSALSELPIAQPEILSAKPEMADIEPEMLNHQSEMPSASLEMLKSESEALKPAPEPLPVEAEPVNVVLQESSSRLQIPELVSEMLNEKVSEQPIMQQEEPTMVIQNTEPEMPMQQVESEMLKTEPELEMPKEQPQPEMMINQDPEPAKEEPEMMKVKLENNEQKVSEEKLESAVPEQSLKTIPEVSEETLSAPVNVEPPALNSEEQKSEIVKAISDLVNEATQEADSQAPSQLNPVEPVWKSEMSALTPAVDMTNENPEPQPSLDMDTLMASPALLDNQLRSDIPLFIPVKVIMDKEPAPELPAVPLPENTLKHHVEGHTEDIVPVKIIDEANKQIIKTAQSESIMVENPVAEEMIVKNLEAPAPEKEVTQVMLETDPVEMKDKEQDASQGTLKAEIFPMPEEEVKIVENLPNIEMGTPEKSEAILPEPEQTDSEPMPSLSQDTAASFPDTPLFDAQPILQEIVNLASNLVKAETISASAEEKPIVLDTADETKETETQDSAIFSKSASTADGLSGAQMVDDHLSGTVAKFSEPIEATPRENDKVSELLRIVSPEKIGELVERTELPESEANRIDLGRSLQKKLDPRKRRFLFKSSAYSR